MSSPFMKEDALEKLQDRMAAAVNGDEALTLQPSETLSLLWFMVMTAASSIAVDSAGISKEFNGMLGLIANPHMDEIVPTWRSRLMPS